METLEDFIKKIENDLKYEEEHPIQTMLKTIFWRWPIHILPRKIKDGYYEIVYFFQRNLRGFSDADFFETDTYIATTIANILEYFKEHHHGLPLGYNQYEYNIKLERIANAFRRYTELDNEELEERNRLYELKLKTNMSKDEYYTKIHEIIKKYDEKYNNLYETMMELFKDGFIKTLWD